MGYLLQFVLKQPSENLPFGAVELLFLVLHVTGNILV
jgi:hypothetical protein